jgi:hypothetical protein
MKTSGELWGTAILFTLLGLFLGMLFFALIGSPDFKARAVEMGFAHYHPQTAELVWDDEKVRYVVEGE